MNTRTKLIGMMAAGLAGIAMVYLMYIGPEIPQADMTGIEAQGKLKNLLASIPWSNQHVNRKAYIQLEGRASLEKSLPTIDEYPLVVNPKVSDRDVAVEIFVTTTRSKSGVDGRMVRVAEDFNRNGIQLAGGKTAKVKIRRIASGTGYQYIASGKYTPDAYSPVHHLWVEMIKEHHIKTRIIAESMVKSVGGIVIKSKTARKIRKKYGNVDVKSIIHEVDRGNIAMGYTNPYHSSTGLNFLITVLSTFADAQENRMLESDVVSAFERFQSGVPFIALTTLQLRDSVRNNGSLDAFIMGHQTYIRTPELQSGYEYIPFGVPHNHPLVAIGEISLEKLEVLELLVEFSQRAKYNQLAFEYGWNQPILEKFRQTVPVPSGGVLMRAQKLWKEKKDAGRPVSAVFLADVSGSMSGTKINQLRKALISGSKFIGKGNSIGLVLFNSSVSVVLPVRKFDLNQKSAFYAAVQDIDTGGGTAMYNGILVSLNLLMEEKTKNAATKPMLFVLTDGENNEGLNYKHTRDIIKGLGIPVYTIGYEAKIEKLQEISSLVEAASLNAASSNIEYKIGSLFNAQM